MIKAIQEILRKTPKLMAKNLAEKLKSDKTAINKILYANNKLFIVNSKFQWSLVDDKELVIEFQECLWMSAEIFEESISGLEILDGNNSDIKFVLSKDCKILLEALARLLALCNQLNSLGKKVIIDFNNCKKTVSYFNRIGFFDKLDKEINIQPYRPKSSKAEAYAGNNNNVVELRSIDPINPDRTIPESLKNSFESCAGPNYSQAAFTILSELFGNVQEHSNLQVSGFAGLQNYSGKFPHIQTVISDSGLGIVGTLMPVLGKKYPKLLEKINSSKIDARVALLQEVFSLGGFSKSDDDGRGLGLKVSAGIANKFKAKISVRQETFELKINYVDGEIKFSHSLNLSRILGTHICFDFLLDSSLKSR
ncbi:hypothetical protein JAB5_13450 [Janthinobacterium sp. HH103]|uniref:hypothetical protein n=1 Tax=unclassified Janthinobacterium TaxID=2610881 RepID=UPI0008933F29|nr:MULTISPECIES: hypothetical protein [unclassified Janthinobacterium]OEZ65344.1 hypothetical protein JAB2_37430 [Janthinobacterium sp. HH100]OEZ84544.1 hypothetical protein JAB5_13450 [Janthinobacterium sp. HH103]QOU71144.1 hypothetical protein JAB4_005400 [Janthinobacterium sp. HH102]